MEKLSQIASSTFTGNVRIIRGGHQTHGLCRAGKHVAERIGKALDFVRPEADFVVDHVVMSRASGTLQPAMRYPGFSGNAQGCGSITNLARRNRSRIQR